MSDADDKFQTDLSDAVTKAVLDTCESHTEKVTIDAQTVVEVLMGVAGYFVALSPDAKVPSRRRKLCREGYGHLLELAAAESLQSMTEAQDTVILPERPN